MLWAITSYFNPVRYRRRQANYRLFRERLKVPLVAVELSNGAGFELDDDDADILIQVHGPDVMWQKERLLNVALGALPASCRKVAWLDCDVIFETDDWPERLSALLDRFALVQAFGCAHHLPPDWVPDDTQPSILFAQDSAVRVMASGGPLTRAVENVIVSGPGSTSKGLAWAARREIVEAFGLYDACIVGGGDLALISAVYGCFDVAMRTMNDRQREHYLAWARPWHDAVSADPGFLDCRVRHLWHGDIDRRQYRERHDGLRLHEFDPFEDIAHDDSSSWRWNTDKPELHAYVRRYFESRREDG